MYPYIRIILAFYHEHNTKTILYQRVANLLNHREFCVKILFLMQCCATLRKDMDVGRMVDKITVHM